MESAVLAADAAAAAAARLADRNTGSLPAAGEDASVPLRGEGVTTTSRLAVGHHLERMDRSARQGGSDTLLARKAVVISEHKTFTSCSTRGQAVSAGNTTKQLCWILNKVHEAAVDTELSSRDGSNHWLKITCLRKWQLPEYPECT